MCGHVGIAGNLAYKDEATMKRLFLLDFFRGPDSTGMAQVKHNGDAVVVKKATNPIDLFDLPSFKSALSGAASMAFIGHNRSATIGGVNNVNAHPFSCGHITGAHNGTLDSTTVKELESLLDVKTGTDSELIFLAIEKFGAKKAIPMLRKGLDKNRGAWSLVWFDSHLSTLNFIRNEWRPMWYAFNKECDRIVWASEWPMIECAIRMSQNGYEMYTEGKENHGYFETKEDIWYAFDLLALKKGGGKRPKPKATPLAGKEMKVTPTPKEDPFGHRGTSSHHGSTLGHGGGTTNGGTGTSQGKNTTGTPSTTHYRSKVKKSISVLRMEGDADNPYASFVDRDKFEEWAKFGCHWCDNPVDFGDQGITLWERDGAVCCKSCCDPDGNRPTRVYIPDLHQMV